MSRVLVTEQISDAGLEKLSDAGHTVDVQLGLSEPQLLDAVQGAHALVIRSSTTVTEDVLAAGSDLVVVGRAGVGLDNVDVDNATKRGVLVVNAPRSNVLSAAEHTIALILAQARNVAQANGALREGRWERSAWSGMELHGKTLGVIGLGRIGGLVAERAAAFGMQLIGYDPYVSAERAREMNVEPVTLDEMAERADIVTVHVARTPETVGLIGRDFLAKAKPSIRVINVARGGIVDEAALYDALVAGKAGGAALDVFVTEPCTDSPLFSLPNVLATPHLGASTDEAQERAGVTIAEQVNLALAGDFVPFAVNIDAADVAEIMKPYLSLAEQLGALLGAFGPESVGDTVEMKLEGEIGGFDNRLVRLAGAKGLASQLSDQPASFVNAERVLAELGVEAVARSSVHPQDYVNRLLFKGRDCSVAATLFGLRDEARIVEIDGHILDVPLAQHMLVIRNDDRPGVIGTVGTMIGDAAINIENMDVGRAAKGGSAVMVIALDRAVPDPVVQSLEAADGVETVTVLSINLDAEH